jgi:hypothetical protein
MVAGAAGGLAGSWAMNRFQALVWNPADPGNEDAGKEDRRRFDRQQASDPHETEEGDATVEAAERVSRRVLGRSLTEREQEVAGTVLHYAFGAAAGAFYGALGEIAPRARTGLGMPFGTSVWVTANEIAMPLLGLTKPPSAYPLPMHATAFGSHVVFGLTAELVRRSVRRML